MSDFAKKYRKLYDLVRLYESDCNKFQEVILGLEDGAACDVIGILDQSIGYAEAMATGLADVRSQIEDVRRKKRDRTVFATNTDLQAEDHEGDISARRPDQ